MNKMNTGFTLVELIVVLAIFGLGVAMTIPAFGSFLQSSRLNGQTSQISGTLQAARRVAVTKNINTVFVLDMANNQYFYFEDPDGNGARGAGEVRSQVIEMPKGVTFQNHTFSQDRVIFGPKGTTVESGTITIQNIHHGTRSIRVFSGTGMISML
jgi:prepilin-type N-terminal cleavage/methylation domain-containing protein